MICPQDYQVSSDTLRKRLKLSESAIITPYGYEGISDIAVISLLKKIYNCTSLLIRTRPDYLIKDDDLLYFVEAKTSSHSVEAIQLLYNKQYENMGITVLYSFPELTIPASLIPMTTIFIPQKYCTEFNKHLKHIFEKFGITNFIYIGNLPKGSGDAFVYVDTVELKSLAEVV